MAKPKVQEKPSGSLSPQGPGRGDREVMNQEGDRCSDSRKHPIHRYLRSWVESFLKDPPGKSSLLVKWPS